MAVTMPPAWEIVVATVPTTPWSGAVWSRIVIEYDDGVADMLLTLALGIRSPDRQDGHQQRERPELGDDDDTDQQGDLDVVQPARQDAAQQRRDRLVGREGAVRRGQP